MSTKKLKSEIEIAGQPKGAAGRSKIELCVNTGIGKVAASCQGQNRHHVVRQSFPNAPVACSGRAANSGRGQPQSKTLPRK